MYNYLDQVLLGVVEHVDPDQDCGDGDGNHDNSGDSDDDIFLDGFIGDS